MIEALQLSALAPDVDPDGAPFWAALAEGRLLIGRCGACSRASFPLIPSCPHCGSPRMAHVDASGEGRVYSWVTVHIALDERFAADVPYTITAVDLVEGPRVLGRLLDQPDRVAADTRVRFAPYRTGDLVLPGFRVAAAALDRDDG